MSKTIELIGRYEGERFRFNNPGGETCIIGSIALDRDSKLLAEKHGVDDVHAWLTIKGDGADLVPSSTYRFLGTFTSYFNKYQQKQEKQFQFRTYVEHVPQDPDGLVKYLIENGRGHGIGPAKAKKIVAYFGVDDVLNICRTEPRRIANLAQIDIEHAESFAHKLTMKQSTENARIEIDAILKGHKFPRTLSTKLIKQFGNEAANIVRADPYVLMQFPRVGFKLADALYITLGKDPASIDRQALYLWYSMASDISGHSWFFANDAITKLREHIGPDADYRSAIKRGRELGQQEPDRYGAIASVRSNGKDGCLQSDGDTLWLAEGKVAAQEQWLAELIASAAKETSIEPRKESTLCSSV
jgi:hypothetical protein